LENHNRITAVTSEDTKQEIEIKVSCFFTPILPIFGFTAEKIPPQSWHNLCHASRVKTAKVSTAESVSY
jgi:hypothetical protein